MNKQYAIFDFDGTLVDSMPEWQNQSRNFLAERGVTEGVEAILERIKPLTITEAARIMIAQFGFPDDPVEIGANMTADMAVRYRETIPVKAGVKAYVTALRERGVKMCVASASTVEAMDQCLTRNGVRELFEFAISCIDVGAGKDRPDVYLAAARRLGASPEEIAVYEDSANAMRTAKGAGFYGVGVYDAVAAGHWRELCELADENIRDWSAV